MSEGWASQGLSSYLEQPAGLGCPPGLPHFLTSPGLRTTVPASPDHFCLWVRATLLLLHANVTLKPTALDPPGAFMPFPGGLGGEGNSVVGLSEQWGLGRLPLGWWPALAGLWAKGVPCPVCVPRKHMSPLSYLQIGLIDA